MSRTDGRLSVAQAASVAMVESSVAPGQPHADLLAEAVALSPDADLVAEARQAQLRWDSQPQPLGGVVTGA
jgi:hypothetical protein